LSHVYLYGFLLKYAKHALTSKYANIMWTIKFGKFNQSNNDLWTLIECMCMMLKITTCILCKIRSLLIRFTRLYFLSFLLYYVLNFYSSIIKLRFKQSNVNTQQLTLAIRHTYYNMYFKILNKYEQFIGTVNNYNL